MNIGCLTCYHFLPCSGIVLGRPHLSRGRPLGVCGRGLELSLDDLLKDLFIQHEIRDGFPEPSVLLLHVLKPLGLINLEAAMPKLSPWLSRTSASLSFAMISSGLAR